MRYIYETHNIRRRYCLPLACESYILKHSFGGIMQSNFIGKEIPEVAQLDGSSKYVSMWDKHPDGTPLWCSGSWIHDYQTFFAKVIVKVPQDLPMGLFPVRCKDGSVIHPKRRGVYVTHLWKERVEELTRIGMNCRVTEGWAWPELTKDNTDWKEWIFNKRINAPSKEVERMCKKVAVSCIGSFSRSRDNFSMVGPSRYSPQTDFPVVSKSVPLDLWIHPEYDSKSAIMPHWSSYTIDSANNDLVSISYPFSLSDKLVMLDVDSVFTKSVDIVKQNYSKKGSVVPYAGQWLWNIHHNFRVLRHRMWVSDEEPSRYGSLLRRIA